MLDSTNHLCGHPETKGPKLSVAFILAPNFTLTPVATFIDALRLAADSGDSSRQTHCQWTIIGPSLDPVVSSCGIEITPAQTFSDPQQFDYIVMAGGLLNKGPQVDSATMTFLKLAAEKHVPLVGICTGSFILARAGLMQGRRCCVSWFHYQDMLTEFPHIRPVADKLFVSDGDRITCAGGIAAIDLAAYLIERHLGHKSAQKSLRILVSEHARKGDAPQPQPTILGDEQVDNPYVRKTMLFLEQNLCENFSSERIAEQVNISKRTLERHFKNELGISLQRYARQLRLHYATWMLANTNRTITEVADETGFADASHFSRIFRTEFDMPPSAIRKKNAAFLLEKFNLLAA